MKVKKRKKNKRKRILPEAKMKPRKTIFPCASKSERNRNTNPRKNCEGARQLTTSLARQKLARKDKRERKRRKEREREKY